MMPGSSSTLADPPATLVALREAWAAQWPQALSLWSKFTRLGEPRWCFTHEQAEAEGLSGSFAMIRLTDQAVVVDLEHIQRESLERFGLEILAHEIGHHVYAPADLDDHARMIARMRWGLPTREHLAAFISNLYTDLLINDRLQRSSGLSMAAVYLALGGQATDPLWTLYMRIYEILWRQQKGTLARGEITDALEGDAQLGARLIRSYARDWLDGAGKFAALCLSYLLADDGQTMQQLLKGWRDMDQAGAGGMPHGLTEIDEGEQGGANHPSLDPELSGLGPPAERAAREGAGPGGARGQAREPFQYGEILESLGIDLTPHEAAIRYYRERAAPLLVPFPSRERPESTEPLPEGLEPWDIGSPIEAADWTESVIISPTVIPGMTTVQRVWGTIEGAQPRREPLDLDLYVDSSGSIANPQVHISYLTLAGAIIALSALRAGGRVQVTLWSGTRQFTTTEGFVTNEHRILEILTGYFGGGTAFPIHQLRDTYAGRKPTGRRVHILVISDDGVTTMFAQDERGGSGWDIAQTALDRAGGGGTLVLNMPADWQNYADLKRAHDQQGWQIHLVRDWAQLLDFARWFARLKYGGGVT